MRAQQPPGVQIDRAQEDVALRQDGIGQATDPERRAKKQLIPPTAIRDVDIDLVIRRTERCALQRRPSRGRRPFGSIVRQGVGGVEHDPLVAGPMGEGDTREDH